VTGEANGGGTTRRVVLAAAGGAGVAATLAACGTGSGPGAAGDTSPGSVLGPSADIPVGGGKVFDTAQVVVTQPTAGDFRCFSAVCTHAGCMVAAVADGRIDCPCHGSQFSATDGSVVTPGPGLTTSSQRPLEEKKITVADAKITFA
jgi:Rieske Fe-S protein